MPNVPLLPAPVKSLRDAARAVRRLADQAVQAVTETTLSQFLDLPEFRVFGYALEEQGEAHIIHLYGEHRHQVALCPRCGTPSTEGHEYEERCVRDLDLMGRHTFVHFTSRRFDCAQCGRPFTEELPSIDRCRRQTRRFELYIYQRCLSTSRKEVAEQEWLDQSTVTDILKRWAKKAVKAQVRPLVRLLGVVPRWP